MSMLNHNMPGLLPAGTLSQKCPHFLVTQTLLGGGFLMFEQHKTAGGSYSCSVLSYPFQLEVLVVQAGWMLSCSQSPRE